VKTYAGFFCEASNHLAAVTNEAFLGMKKQLLRSLADHEHPATNSVPDVETNLLQTIPELTAPALNATNSTDVPSKLLLAPPPAREQKPQ